jgi:uncharacterized SAM-binding protein YcdF (DUF218 family)
MLLAPFRLAFRIFSLFVLAILVYYSITLVQVWLTSRHYEPQHAGAIVVMGAAQYTGVPSLDLKARLNEALTLFHHGDANLIAVTGGKEPGDAYTEAQAGAHYLESNGVPANDIIEAGGGDSYRNIADAVPKLKSHHVRTVLIVTDPFHEYRSMAIASELKLVPWPTPTQHSPISGWSTVPYFLKEAGGAAVGRIIGYSHLEWLHAA